MALWIPTGNYLLRQHNHSSIILHLKSFCYAYKMKHVSHLWLSPKNHWHKVIQVVSSPVHYGPWIWSYTLYIIVNGSCSQSQHWSSFKVVKTSAYFVKRQNCTICSISIISSWWEIGLVRNDSFYLVQSYHFEVTITFTITWLSSIEFHHPDWTKTPIQASYRTAVYLNTCKDY